MPESEQSEEGLFSRLKNRLKVVLDLFDRRADIRTLTILWSVFFLFLAGSILSQMNPFRLLIPGAVFPFPASDERVLVPVYGYSRDENQIQKAEQRLLKSGSTGEMIFRYARIVSNPGNVLARDFEGLTNLQTLPFYSLAIRHAWVRDSKAIIDFRKKAIIQETASFRRARAFNEEVENVPEFERYLQCLALTILENEQSVQQVQFLVDGRPATESDFEFSAGDTITR